MAPSFFDAWRELPQLQWKRPGKTAYMRHRADVSGDDVLQDSWTKISELSPYALCAIIGAEDPAFFLHRGIWWAHLANQTYTALRNGQRLSAVSTITQQLARNLYLAEERSFARKLCEMLLAHKMERVIGKERILELYVNVVEWGSRIWGIGNASRFYFGATPDALDPFQAVVLASLLPAPRAPLVGSNLYRAVRVQLQLLHFLYAAGIMTVSEWKESKGRIMRFKDEVGSGRPAHEVLTEIGRTPCDASGTFAVSTTPAELLSTKCGLTLRIAYTTLLIEGGPEHTWIDRLPERWSGKLIA